MDGLTAEERRLVVGNFYTENMSLGKPYTVHPFMRMGLKRVTIYKILQRVDKQITLKHRPGQGRPPIKMT